MSGNHSDTENTISPQAASDTQLAMLQLLIRRGEYQQAEQLCLHFRQHNPEQLALYRLLFQLWYKQRRFAEVLQLASDVCQRNAEFLPGWLAQLYCLRQQQRHNEAIDITEALLKKQPDNISVLLQQAILFKDTGNNAGALTSLQRLIALKPDLAEAYWLRADLLQQPSDGDIAQMHAIAATCSNNSDKAHMHYAIARAEEKRENFSASFTQLNLGAAAKKRTFAYQHQAEIAEYHAIAQCFANKNKAKHRFECSSTPVFICGLPRSGTTLAEQILSSHPDVTAGDELFDLAQATASILTTEQQQLAFPRWVQSTTSAQWQQLGQEYLRLTSALQHNTYFTDKMPLNFKAIGIIKAALPHAKIVYCQRHPMDTLFSCYKQLFADGIAFSYDLDELADIYIAQQQLMAHWNRLYGDDIFILTYERLVKHQRSETERLLSYIGLPWSDRCMQFYQNSRAVFTVSNSQVRQPLYQSGVGHWLHYQKQLQPLYQRLQPYIEQYQATLCSEN